MSRAYSEKDRIKRKWVLSRNILGRKKRPMILERRENKPVSLIPTGLWESFLIKQHKNISKEVLPISHYGV